MRLKSFTKSSGLAALAAGLAALALPSAASAEPGDHGRGGDRGGWHDQSDNRGGGEGRGNNWRGNNEARPAPAPAPAPQAQQPAAPPPQAQPRNWGGDRNGAEPGRGWGSQRPAEGQRYGRDWNNGGAVNRPEPAFRNNAPAVQPPRETPRFEAPRNQSYAAPDRNRAYAPRQQGWDGRQWQGQNADRNWDRDRSVRTAPQPRWNNDRRDNWNRDDRRDNWSRDWRRDNRYNWQSYRSTNRQIYRLPRYYAPYRDYSYRRLSIGFFLDDLFFGSNYWISDPWMYRLPPAYGPYRWVRYYDDALLVNIYDGEVVDVIYDFFW